MRKIFYYNFMPTKKEEEAAAAARNGAPGKVTRTLVEVRDRYALPTCGASPTINPWHISKTISDSEVARGVLVVSEEDMLEHVFRHWSLDTANHVVHGNPYFVSLVDYTDDGAPKKYNGKNVFVKNNDNNSETYMVGIKDVIVDRAINPGDDICLVWDFRNGGSFAFKLLRRG